MTIESVNEAIAESVANVKRLAERLASLPTFERAEVTAVNPDGTIDLLFDSGEAFPSFETIAEHVKEVGLTVMVGRSGGALEVITSDVIAARTIIAEHLAVLVKLSVGQALESASFVSGADGVGYRLADDGVELNTDVIIRGLLQMLPGRNILPNGDRDQSIEGYTVEPSGGSIAHDTSVTDSSPGALSHTTPASTTERYVESGFVPIDRRAPVLYKERVRLDAATVQARLGVLFFDEDENQVGSTVFGAVVTGTSGVFLDAECYAEPPQVAGGNVGSNLYYPNADVLVDGGAFGSPTDSAGNRWQNLDEAIPSAGDYVGTSSATAIARYRSRFSIVASAMSGRMIQSVTFRYWVARGDDGPIYTHRRQLRIGSTDWPGGIASTGAQSPDMEEFSETFTTNPATGNPWTAGEVEAFRNGGTNAFGVDMYSSDAAQVMGVVAMSMEVNWQTSTTGLVPALAKFRAYTKPALAVARTTRWDRGEAREQPAQYGGNADMRKLRMRGSIEPLDQGAATVANAAVGNAYEVVGSAQTVWNPAAADRRRCSVRARFFGSGIWVSLASPQVLQARVGISFDGGSTWAYGDAPKTEIASNEDRGIGAAHAAKGVPTGAVQVRVEAIVSAGYSTDVSVQGTIDWTLQPADAL